MSIYSDYEYGAMSDQEYRDARIRENRKERTIPEIVEDVKCEICRDYCKYPDIWDEEAEEMELIDSEHCQNCPLNRL